MLKKQDKLIIFDCDGVLVDSEVIASHVDAHALTNLGYPLTAEESIRRFTGVSSKKDRQIILEESGIHIPEYFFEECQRTIIQSFEKELKPLMLEVLNILNKKKIKCCVASSSPKPSSNTSEKSSKIRLSKAKKSQIALQCQKRAR